MGYYVPSPNRCFRLSPLPQKLTIMEDFASKIHEQLCTDAATRITFYLGEILGSRTEAAYVPSIWARDDNFWLRMDKRRMYPNIYRIDWYRAH